MKLHEIKSKDKSVTDLHISYKGGNFYCDNNKLTSLVGAPTLVDGNFDCARNLLTSLASAPSSVGGEFNCYSNELTSLVGAPTSVGGSFYGGFYCNDNELTSLEGAPTSVGGNFSCTDNELTSLANIHRQISHINGVFFAVNNPIRSHVLGLLLIKGITKIFLDNNEVQDILNMHLPSRGMRDVLEAQDELVEVGLEEFAQL